VQIDRPVADGAAAGQADRRLTVARQQRPKHKHGRAHLAHDVIGRDRRGDAAGFQGDDPAEILGPPALRGDRHAMLVQQVAHGVNVSEPRQAAQGQRLVGQQGAGHEGQRRVLGTGYGDAPLQGCTALHDQFVHRAHLATRRAAHNPHQGQHDDSKIKVNVVKFYKLPSVAIIVTENNMEIRI